MFLIKRIKRLCFSGWTVPLGLLAVCAFAYLPLLPTLGLYWDDWTQLLVNHLYDLSTYWDYFSYDRPFSAWTNILFVPLLGYKPLHWHLLSFFLRWLTVWGMWWTFCQLWPRRKPVVTFAAFLFAVYPSFTQQSDAVVYHQHWTQYSLYFLSLGSMVTAVRASLIQKKKRFWSFSALSVASLVLHLSITEFFIGVEMLRSVMLWFVVAQAGADPEGKKAFWTRLKRTVSCWLPYLAVDLGFIFWRVFVYSGEKNPAILLEDLAVSPLSATGKVLRFALMDSLFTLVTSWGHLFDLRIFQIDQPVVLLSWLISLICAAALTFYLIRLSDFHRQEDRPNGDHFWRWQMLMFGALVVLSGPSPLWIAGRQLVTPLTFDFHTDRFSLVGMYGASLMIAAGIDWFIQDWKRKSLFLSVVVGLAAGFHIRTGNDYRWIWVQQQRFYYQLFWRAPYLEAGTAVVIENEVLPHQENFSTGSALNFIYPQEKYPEEVGYWMYRLSPRFDSGFPDGFMPGFHTTHRIYTFNATAPTSILVQYDPEQTASCVWVLRPEDKGQPDLSPLMNQAIHISNLDRISKQSRGFMAQDLLGSEPEHDWCYYFQKADLARQYEDWAKVVELGDEVSSIGFGPGRAPANSPYEWLPFIEGYLHEGRWDDAVDITVSNYQTKKEYGNVLCKLWSGFAAESEPGALDEIQSQVGCNF
jgi:hypothetical protein